MQSKLTDADNEDVSVGGEWTTVAHQYKIEYDVDIGRGEGSGNMRDVVPTESGWIGNPFVIESKAKETHEQRDSCEIVESRAESIRRFRQEFRERVKDDPEFREAVEDLRGKTLGCYCKPKSCHGDVIVAWLAEQSSE